MIYLTVHKFLGGQFSGSQCLVPSFFSEPRWSHFWSLGIEFLVSEAIQFQYALNGLSDQSSMLEDFNNDNCIHPSDSAITIRRLATSLVDCEFQP
jgi:hypothetical protein